MKVTSALFQAGPTVTAYRRAGSGAPVLLLFPGGGADPLGADVFARLAERFRVVAPDVPDGIPFAAWLRDLIEGLGLERPGIVADGCFAGAARELAREDPERVGRVVAVPRC